MSDLSGDDNVPNRVYIFPDPGVWDGQTERRTAQQSPLYTKFDAWNPPISVYIRADGRLFADTRKS